MNRFKTNFLFILFLLFVGGCLSFKQPVRKINYYSLEYESPVQNAKQILPSVIRVERFHTAPFYDTNKIVFRKEAFEKDAYIYHKWWAKPGDIVSYFLARDMKASGHFKAVSASDKGLPFSHVMQGSVEEFFEEDEAESWQAVLSVEIILLSEDEPDVSKKILFQKTYRTRKACTQKTPKSLAGAMSHAMAEISEKVITDICSELGN